MNMKTVFGWIAILAISLSPVFLWNSYGAGFAGMTDYDSVVHVLGELFGLVGMNMFALTFVLATRIGWIEDVFGGLDKVYMTHGILGGTALILIMAHPIFLVLKFIPDNVTQAALYLLPSSYWSVNFGIIALLGMMALIFITLFTKMKYQHWKFTHEFLGLMYFFAVLHIVLVRDTVAVDNIFDGYPLYAAIVSLVGLLSFAYSLFLKNRIFRNAIYSVRSMQEENGMFHIVLEPENKPIQYRSGQFVFVRIYNEKISKEAHPFSIASKSNDQYISIVVKKLGDYTSELGHIEVGDKVALEGPYGRFLYQKKDQRDQIWIAGGIGITPFLGMALDLVQNTEFTKKVTLFFSVKSRKDLIGLHVLQEIEKRIDRFRCVPWVSDDKGWLTVDTIADTCGEDFSATEFFLCGPPQLKSAVIDGLQNRRVPKRRIHEEAFDLV